MADGETRIVDAAGRPIKRPELKREQAAPSLTGVRQVWHDGVASSLTPDRLGAILRAAADNDAHEYLTLAEEMEEREPHYAAVLGTRKRAVAGLEVNVEAASDDAADERLAEEVRELVRRPSFDELVEDALDALGKGYSVCEIDWDTSARQWYPRGYIWRDPRFFRFDREAGQRLRLLTQHNNYDGEPLAPYKFVTHFPRIKSGLPLRGGLARLVAVTYMAKSYTLTDWLAFCEVFGMPLRLGRYDGSATSDDIAKLRSAVANLGSDAAAVLPKGMEIEFQEMANSTGGQELFQNLAEWLDKQTSKAVLGQTMTADDGSSYAQAGVHNDVRGDIQQADAKHLANTINRDLIEPFIQLNHGRQERYPYIRFHIPQPEDVKQLVDAVVKLAPYGMDVEASTMRNKLGLPDPEADAEVLRPPQPAAAPPSAPALNRAANREDVRATSEDALDELAEAADDWQPQLAPLVDPVERLARQVADEGGDADTFLKRLPELLDEMDETELVRRLATANLKARGLGDASDTPADADGDG